MTAEEEQSTLWKLPLVIVNGGPGFSHEYALPTKQIACWGRKVIFYDQVGSGKSDRPTYQQAPWLWDNIETYYIEELQLLTQHLNISKFHLLGHSWGGIVAQYYAIQQPANLAALILASTLSDSKLYIEAQRDFLHSTLPPFVQAQLSLHEEKKDYDSPIYRKIEERLTGFWTIRTAPIPDCVQNAFESVNREVYVGIQGASEFTVGGKLEKFNITSRLSSITAPTLVTSGRYDTMTSPVIDALLEGIPQAQYFEFPHSGHLTMVDDAVDFSEIIEGFLISIDLDQATPEALQAREIMESIPLDGEEGGEEPESEEEEGIRDEL